MRAEVRMPLAILAVRAMTHTVGERRFQTIEVCSLNVHSFVRHQTYQPLADALTHNACLAVMNLETFFEQDRRRVN